MVEVISQSNGQEKLKLPKNIRQIGLPEEKKKIYVEDYVVTYMNQLASEFPNRQSAAVLLGFHTRQNDVRLTFINGAIGIPTAEVDEDVVSFRSELWEDIYNTMRDYFHNCEIVGWFLTRPGKSLGLNEKITKIHVDQFPGREKTLFLMDPLDKEEAFFLYEGGQLVRQQGYYIYYERNEDMQNYMVEHRKGHGSEEILEAATLRRTAIERRRKSTESGGGNHWVRAAAVTIGTAAVVAAVGVTLIHRGYLPVQIKTVSSTVAEETKTIQVVESRMETEAQSIEAKNGDTEEATAAASGTVYKHYTVRRGDTLANISLSLYDSRDYVDTICEINDIEDPDVIYEGMVLELP